MRKLEIPDGEAARISIQQEIMRSEDSRYDHRLHGLLLISNGLNCYEVAKLFGQSPRTVQYWVQRFQNSGFAGLVDSPRGGRPAVLGHAQAEAVGRDLRRSPRDLGYDQNLWDGKLLSHHLKEAYGIELGVRQCQRLFQKFQFRRRKPRPLIAKADPEAQEAFKKNSKTGGKP